MSDEPWSIQIERRAYRDISRLDRQVRDRIIPAIDKLADEPDQASIRRLRGRPENRLRVSDWRVIFLIDPKRRVIKIQRVLPRGRAYKR